jgi:hypothetical protein
LLTFDILHLVGVNDLEFVHDLVMTRIKVNPYWVLLGLELEQDPVRTGYPSMEHPVSGSIVTYSIFFSISSTFLPLEFLRPLSNLILISSMIFSTSLQILPKTRFCCSRLACTWISDRADPSALSTAGLTSPAVLPIGNN